MTALQSESIAAIMPALLKAEAGFSAAKKGAVNPHFKAKYADLESVIDAVRPSLLANDIVVMQPTRFEGGKTVLVTRLVHKSGEWLGSEYPINPVQASPQAEGSALTYARRYALLALCGIAPEDDDGEAASAPQGRTQGPRVMLPTNPPRIAAEPRPYENPDRLQKLIDAAGNPDELHRVGEQIGAAWLENSDADCLRDNYRQRMAELKGTAA